MTNSIALHRQQSLMNFIERFNQRTATSKKMAQHYRPVLADNKTFVEFNPVLKELFYPIVAKRSLGANIWDVDGNEYIDLTMGFGVNLLGHNPSFIKEAITTQLDEGIQIGPQAELAGEVAQLISEFTKMERVAFSNTGTEAVMTAIRLARTATGRNKIVLFKGSYHGHFDGTLAKSYWVNEQLQSLPISPGTPFNFVQDVLVLDYGKPESLDLIKTHASELAGVLVEPVQTRNLSLKPLDFLKQLRQLTQNLEIPLIFDEMVTGFRIHPGGAQAWFGIQADIATYGKIVGGGLPIGVIAGQAKYMNAIDGGMWQYGDSSYPQEKTTFFAGTFCKHPLSLAAAKAVLEYLKTQGASLQTKLNDFTSDFVAQLNTYFNQEQIPIQMTSFGSVFGPVVSSNADSENNSEVAIVFDLLYYHLLFRGIMLRGGGGFLSTAHTSDDIEKILDAVKESVQELRAGYFLP